MLRDFVGAGRKLHFTDVDDVVDAVDQKVELCAVFPRIYPATRGTFYSRDSECVQDLRIMLKAQHFECVAAPTVVFRLTLDLQPLVAATLRPFREEPEIEKRVEIDELNQFVFGLLAKGTITPNESAIFKIVQGLGHAPATLDRKFLD